jgi:NAD(P)-dependent dehydrogenase (short-subunit alcohol dehydrogenase family)
MDLGLSDKKGIVCAASKGLGRAVAFALAREGVDLIINADIRRSPQRAQYGARKNPLNFLAFFFHRLS